MKGFLKNLADMFVIAVFSLVLAACGSSGGGGDMGGEMPAEMPTRLTLEEAIATPDIVRGTLNGAPYAAEQLLGDSGDTDTEVSLLKNDLPLDDDGHALKIDGGTVRQDRGSGVDFGDPSLAPDAPNAFTPGAAPARIAGFSGSTHDRDLPDIDEVHVVVVYTDKMGNGDTDYVDFGYWFLDYAADDHVGHFTHTFARGSMPSGDVSAVTGSASYAGAATGLYVQGSGDDAVSGQFTASASLTADFDANTMSGSISDFKDASGEGLYPAWLVNLHSSAIDPAMGRTPLSLRGGTTGGGTWKAEFHGDASAGAPGTVAGTFDAHLVNGSVGGAFAAHKQ